MTNMLLDSAGVEAPAPPPANRARGRRTLLLLALVCALPVIASYLMFYVWQPQGRVNHGELIAPHALPTTALSGAAGQPELKRSEIDGQWTMVMLAPSNCDAACERALYVSRQARVAQSKEMERVSRVWLITDGGEPASDRLARHQEMRVAHADPAWRAALAGAAPGALWLVDPLGNVMMRFPDAADTTQAARDVSKDLKRLLKYSPLGRGGRE